MDSVNSRLQRMYGQQSTAYVSAMKKAYLNTVKPSDYVDLDINFRQGAIRQATAKAIAGAAPVYMYLFAWQSPVNDGIYKAMHCMELPFVFNNIDRCEEMTGGGRDAHALADKMSGAWINFAKTGNPNTTGLPTWPMFTAATGSTMIFDSQSRVANHPDAELLKIASARPGM
jgi:para-nitrobenzyl esterase